MTIYYFDALAGAGKTRALARYADRIARCGAKVLFVQPTKHLIDKTLADELLPLDPTYPCCALHGDAISDDTSVVAEIVEHFRGAEPDQGEVLLITHAALMRVPYLHKKGEWHLIMDEVPQVDEFEALPLPETHGLILPYLVFEAAGPVYGRLMERDVETVLDAEAVSFTDEAA
ncbi:hypothetical protein FV219_00805 [Methylobacterium sp. WL122]|nr:hypothetical protein FV219_00805 [Methylobacterium sp. WL122]